MFHGPRVLACARARFATLFLTLCAAMALAGPAGAETQRPLPTQGVYDTCDPVRSPDSCASRLRRLSQAGFRVVQIMGISPQVTNLTAVLAYANAAQANGVKVIWNVRPGSSEVDLLAVLAALRVHPSTWGYYIYDEPTPEDHDKVAAFAARVKALDPAHPRLIMGCGNCYGGEGSVSSFADIDAALGSDIYPVWEQAPDQPIVAQKVGAVAAGLRRVADRAGRQTVMALQAWRWGDSHYDSQATGIGQASRFPTQTEIQAQRDAAIAGGHPDLILWFTLNQVIGWEPGQRPWWWAEPSDPGTRWANLVGGAFAPQPEAALSKPPVARFSLRVRRQNKTVHAARRGTLKITVNGTKSSSTNSRIVRYRWYASGKPGAVCAKPRCSLRWPAMQKKRRTLKLVVTDTRGAHASTVRQVPKPRR